MKILLSFPMHFLLQKLVQIRHVIFHNVFLEVGHTRKNLVAAFDWTIIVHVAQDPFKGLLFVNVHHMQNEAVQGLVLVLIDIDFDSTNPGVWTMTMDHFKQSAGFTSWNDYKQDEPIAEVTHAEKR